MTNTITITIKETIEQKVVKSIICDVCKKEYTVEDDIFEYQEFFSIRRTGGYGSVFGDGVTISCDICQHCFKKLLGKYITEIDE